MKYIIVAVRDSKSEIFGQPFVAQTVGAAVRSFDDEVNRNAQNNILNTHPEDFHLFQLGEYEDKDGTITTITPKLLVHGDEVKKAVPMGVSHV